MDGESARSAEYGVTRNAQQDGTKVNPLLEGRRGDEKKDDKEGFERG